MNKDEKRSIYEIYRACRLCGAGAGYKMPIIQSVIDAEGEETELKQKIRECVQIEVNLNDRMPPLICELCVDKINDFFEFRALCLETNRKTRLRLGLPLQTIYKEEPQADNCIVDATETVYINSDSDEGEPLSKQTTTVRYKPGPKCAKMKKESDGDAKIKIVNHQTVVKEKVRSPSPEVQERRETRRRHAPSPKRTTRQNKTDDMSFIELQDVQILQKSSSKARPVPKSFQKRERERQESEKEEKPDDSLLVSKQKRLREREVVVEIPAKKAKVPELPKTETVSRPGPKCSKMAPKTTPPQKQVKAGPKSKQREPSPVPPPKSRKTEASHVPAVKSRKSEPTGGNTPCLPGPPGPKSRRSLISPAPKSRQREPSPIPTLRSKKQEVSALPAPKSKKRESSPVPTSNTRRRDPSPPAPKSKKREREPSPKPPQKVYECDICGYKAKAGPGLWSHSKVHAPLFTPIKLSCNACELWFSTAEEAAWHHRRHSNMGLPYTCGKCYDDFRTAQDYELHFTRNQCLSTYEVPDVKCDECWHYFPTYKLLEDHKCPGEGGRPGGKCGKCKRVYALLKTLTAHEMKCNVKKKKGVPLVDPEISRRLLPMQVRIARCDALLKNPTEGGYNVSGISHTFGLDRDCTYPYLYSMGDVRIKTEPSINTFNHMVSIKDDIKEEYLHEDSYVHWDSDVSEDSDNDGSLFDPFKNKRSVDTLSTISLKTIFSSKFLGKVPRKKRKFKTDKEIGSILSIGFHKDMRRNIDVLIDSLGSDSQHSNNYDSDSILDNKISQNKGSEINLNSLIRDLSDDIVSSESKIEEAKEKYENSIESDVIDSDSNNINKKTEGSEHEEIVSRTDENLSQTGSVIQNSDSSEKEHVDNQVDKDVNEVTDYGNTKPDTATTSSPQLSNTASNATENNLDLASKHIVVSQNNNNEKCTDDSKNDQEASKEVVSEKEPLPIEDKVEIGTSQTEPEKIDVDEQIELETRNSSDISSALCNSREIEISELVKEASLSNNDKNKMDISTEADDLKSSKEISDKANDNLNSAKDDKIHISNDTNTESENDSIADFRASNYNDENDKNTVLNSINSQNSMKTEGDIVSKNVKSADKFNINDLNDDEKQLMADLDEQIGENQSKSNVIDGNKSGDVTGENKSHNEMFVRNDSLVMDNLGFTDVNSEENSNSLEVLMQKQDDLKSLDLDSISDDEFDFDI